MQKALQRHFFFVCLSVCFLFFKSIFLKRRSLVWTLGGCATFKKKPLLQCRATVNETTNVSLFFFSRGSWSMMTQVILNQKFWKDMADYINKYLLYRLQQKIVLHSLDDLLYIVVVVILLLLLFFCPGVKSLSFFCFITNISFLIHNIPYAWLYSWKLIRVRFFFLSLFFFFFFYLYTYILCVISIFAVEK